MSETLLGELRFTDGAVRPVFQEGGGGSSFLMMMAEEWLGFGLIGRKRNRMNSLDNWPA